MKTFESGKNANELQIDVNRKFIVVKWSGEFNEGDILNFHCDKKDGMYPLFIRESDGKKRQISWSNLYYYEEEELKTGDDVLVKDEGDTSELEKIFLFKKGKYFYCIDKEEEEDDYISIICTRWDNARKKPKEEKKEMTIEKIEKELGYKIKIVNE